MKLISEELVGGILAYLLTRPMKEVEQGVIGLRNLQDAPEPIPAKQEPIMQG